MNAPARSMKTDGSDDADYVRIRRDESWKLPDHSERGVGLPGFEPTWAPPEEDDDPAPPTRTDERAEPGV